MELVVLCYLVKKKNQKTKKETMWLESSVQNCFKFSSTFKTILSDVLLHCSLGKPEHKHAVGMPQNRTCHQEDNKTKQI